MSGKVLISGAGVGGSTLAHWLSERGFDVTVVERATGQRSSGNPVDVRGFAIDVVEQMGVMPELRKSAIEVDRLSFIDSAGRRRTSVATKAPDASEVELARAELAKILLGAARDRAEIRWGDTITGLNADESGVSVTFEQHAPETFDYVVGADGLHSNVRRLAFGPERDFVRHMGIYVATLPVDRAYGDPDEVVMYNTPGRSISVHPAGGKPLAALMFRSPAIPGYDYRDLEQHKRLLCNAFDGPVGIFGDLLDQIDAADDLYFDAVSKVQLPTWSKGRVTLLGDAGSSVSLFGDGSSLAIAAASTLAEELARTPGEPDIALRRYEQRQRVLSDPKQNGARAAGMFIVPRSRLGILLRDTAARFMRRVRADGNR
ncbi:FAD-dependent monooxygenase [Nocardia sp. NBC_01503]|uniref:FAD-dependent monooxygenase n=1 Tax=Nocardia sp. NBC_01503 TaxID=2975997 RepID=UPI002E7C211A|nr:FAD-dependent monooxygenase [Nocardia sp. NBC_01503]WTL32864.1 FAD-dependent monooxygenase [Nocardia sp. NBC_01503]